MECLAAATIDILKLRSPGVGPRGERERETNARKGIALDAVR
jgi:hypothetical protein